MRCSWVTTSSCLNHLSHSHQQLHRRLLPCTFYEWSHTTGQTSSSLSMSPSIFILACANGVLRILLNLRRAATPDTKLLIADHILPHACIDEQESLNSDGDTLPGFTRTLAPEESHLLPNLGKANSVSYWLDLTVSSQAAQSRD